MCHTEYFLRRRSGLFVKGDENNNPLALRRYVDAPPLAAFTTGPDFPKFAIDMTNMGHPDIMRAMRLN